MITLKHEPAIEQELKDRFQPFKDNSAINDDQRLFSFQYI